MLLIVLDMPPSSHASPAKRFCAQQQLSSALCYAALSSTFSVVMQMSIHICSRPQAWQPGVAPVWCSVVVPHWNHRLRGSLIHLSEDCGRILHIPNMFRQRTKAEGLPLSPEILHWPAGLHSL